MAPRAKVTSPRRRDRRGLRAAAVAVIWAGVLAGLAGAVLVAGLPAPSRAQDTSAKEPQPVVVAVVRSAELVDRVEALGTTRANETVDITANVTEKIVDIGFTDGQAVAAGDVLVLLESAEEDALLKAAEAVLEERRLAFERAKKLESQQFASTAQLDERRAALQEAHSEIAVIRAQIADRVIRAPFDGIVGLRNVSVGALVSPGDLITTLDDVSVIKVDFSVPTVYLDALRPGLPIVAKTAAFGEREFTGAISSIASRVDPATRSILARAVMPNPDGTLRPGLLMSIALLKNPRRAIVVPENALIPEGRRNFVLIVDEAGGNVAEKREVRIGARRPGEVEIIEGVREEEKVITRGTLLVRHGQPVRIIAVEEAEQAGQSMVQPAAGG